MSWAASILLLFDRADFGDSGPLAIFKSKLLLVVAGIFVLLYILGPVIVWLTQKQAANPQLMDYSSALNQPSFRMLASFCSIMQSAGFEFAGVFGLVGQTSNVNAYMACVVHRRNKETGTAIFVHAPTAPAHSKLVLEFSTRFADQSSITTSNSRTPSVLSRADNKPVYKFPAVQDPLRLYHLHQQLVARDKPGFAKDIAPQGGEAARIVEGMQEDYRVQLQTGMLKLDYANKFYRPTLLGAFCMTWKLLPPFKQLAEESLENAAGKLLRSLENPGILYTVSGAVEGVQPRTIGR